MRIDSSFRFRPSTLFRCLAVIRKPALKMKLIDIFGIFLVCAILGTSNSQFLPNYNNNNNNNQQYNQQLANRQVGGISFAIPGLSLLAGNNAGVGVGGIGGNFFGPATFTRTLVSTVSTVTTASFRTCTSVMAGLMPCAGRRKRDAEEVEENNVEIQATPIIKLIIGSTTISNPADVTEYLEAHKPSLQSVIYPPGIEINSNGKVMTNPQSDAEIRDDTTILYPSQDTPETTEIPSANNDEGESLSDDISITTVTPGLQSENFAETSIAETTPNDGVEVELNDKARVGLGRTTTVTTIIRVTSVATTLATGSLATLTVNYAGCSPPVFPVSGLPCA